VPDLPGTRVEDAVPDGHSYALLLTHDVDRPYKTYQSIYYAVRDRDPTHLADLLPGRNPYWQFESAMAVEDDLGVRSAFYFLREQDLFRDRPVSEWTSATAWMRYLGRYSLADPAIRSVARDLRDDGWEVGLHGSYESYRDPDRLAREKRRVEEMVDDSVVGGRQHYLNLDVPATWRYHRDIGLRYDATPGSSAEVGFHHGYRPVRPFDDEFVVFPLTMMENALPDPGEEFDRAWRTCRRVLDEARDERAVASVLWPGGVFAVGACRGPRRRPRGLAPRPPHDGAWVGPPADLYERLDHPDSTIDDSADASTDDDADARTDDEADVAEPTDNRAASSDDRTDRDPAADPGSAVRTG
jgi:hypothetical protein